MTTWLVTGFSLETKKDRFSKSCKPLKIPPTYLLGLFRVTGCKKKLEVINWLISIRNLVF
jgi:hypothetical protein